VSGDVERANAPANVHALGAQPQHRKPAFVTNDNEASVCVDQVHMASQPEILSSTFHAFLTLVSFGFWFKWPGAYEYLPLLEIGLWSSSSASGQTWTDNTYLTAAAIAYLWFKRPDTELDNQYLL
jgi:hypothetical protein